MRKALLVIAVVTATLIALAAIAAVDGSRARSELAVAEPDELLGIGETQGPTADPTRLRVVVADIDLGARIGASDTLVGTPAAIRESVDGITTALEHFDADIIVLFDVAESLDGLSRPMVRTIAAESGLRFMLQTRHWSKRRAWWPIRPVFAPVGPVDAAHVVYTRWPIARTAGTVRAPRGRGMAHRWWGPWDAWMAGRIDVGPTRSVAIAVDAGTTGPALDDTDLRLRACLGPCEADEGGGTVVGDDAQVGLSFGPGFELLRAVTHGRMHGTLVHCVVYAELAIAAPAGGTPPPSPTGPE